MSPSDAFQPGRKTFLKYRVREISHAGDTGAEIEAATGEDLFAGAIEALLIAMGLSAVRRDVAAPDSVGSIGTPITVETHAAELGELLVSFLNDVLYLFSAEGIVPAGSSPPVLSHDDDGWHLSIHLSGQPYEPSVHGFAREVKAVTYHRLEVRIEPAGAFARVIFDL